MQMYLKASLFIILSCFSLLAQAVPQSEESVCADANVGLAADSTMQIRITSTISIETGFASKVTLLRNDREDQIGQATRAKLFDLSQAPLIHGVHVDGKNGTITFSKQATISRGNGSLKLRQATWQIPGEVPKTLLCFFSSF